ncbi:hypothetical protein [Sandarakinorhabdus sp.]|uniref:hypothetical protein n=1 Tax=Sandarakinorhabdus sp. TaxID=1916663 RepID=UPI00286D72BC|nr:hypothetical protein [Sandarakinorhabdus sp.]
MISSAHAAPPSVPSVPPLTGDWGGPQVRLQLTETGGKLDLACASAIIDMPVRPDAAGKFVVLGRYDSFTGGPTPADAAPAMAKAHFDGHVEGDTMHLSVHRHGEKAAENYTLERGRRVKLIRCG